MFQNKKAIKIAIFIFVSILVLAATYFIFYYFIETYSTSLDPVSCMLLFGVTPEEFMETEFEFYDETGDFRKKAYIDENGHLVLVLTRWQRKAWRNTEWLSGFSEYPDKQPFSISSDYSELTAYIPTDIDPNGEEYQSILEQAETIVNKMALIRIFDGVPAEYVYTKYSVIDSSTGEVLYTQYVKWMTD